MIYNRAPNAHSYSSPLKYQLPFISHQPSLYSRSQSNRLQQLKLNNPFQKINSKMYVPFCKQQTYVTKPIYRNISNMENPFHRKYLIRNEEQDNYFDYINYPTKQVMTSNHYSQPSQIRNTVNSLQFLPTNSKKQSKQQTKPNQIRNRMGGDFNNYNIRLQSSQKYLTDIIQHQSKQHQNTSKQQNKQVINPDKYNINLNLINNHQSVTTPISKLQSQVHFNDIKQNKDKDFFEKQKQQKDDQIQQIFQQISSQMEQKQNEDQYSNTIRLEGKTYHLIPFKNK